MSLNLWTQVWAFKQQVNFMLDNTISRFDTGVISSSITRPANTTQYAAGDVIAAVTTNNHFVFSGCLRTGFNTGFLSGARITSSANQSTKLDAQLFLFSSSQDGTDPITETADNAAWSPTDDELAARIGVVNFPVADWFAGDVTSGAGGNSGCDANNLGVVLRSNPDIYGVLVARNTYTPVSGEVFTISLLVTRD
jgi:hypothetical protein